MRAMAVVPCRIAMVLWLAAGMACSAFVQSKFEAKVVGITDGDTVTVLKKERDKTSQIKIRLHGIDCPEQKQPFFAASKKRISDLIFQKIVTVMVTGRDRYGRTTARLFIGKTSVEEALVSEGLAWWYRKYDPENHKLEKAESKARKAKRGIWSQPNPIPPWDWRNGGRSSASSASYAEGGSERAKIENSVYVTKNGKTYHRPGCKYVAEGSRAISVKEAKAQGLEPCKVCKPG